MAEEATPAAQEQGNPSPAPVATPAAPAAPAAPAPQQPSQQVLDERMEAANMLASLGGSLSEETRAQLMKMAGDVAPTVLPTPQEEPKVDPFKGETGSIIEDPAEKAAEKPAAPAATETKKKDILGLNKKKAAPGAEEDFKFEKLEDVLSAFAKNTGMELKDPSELNKVIQKTKAWRQDSENLVKVKTDLDQFVEGFNSLPEEIHEAVSLFSKGQDFRQALEKKGLDLKKDVTALDKKELINHYFPGKFTDDDFTQEEPSAALEIAEEASKKQFNVDKQQFEAKRALIAKQQEDSIKIFNASVESSVTNLTQSFPDADQDGINAVKQAMLGGPDGVLSLLMEKGAFKPDAAKRLLFMLHGEDLISDYAEVAANQRETALNEDLLKHSTDRPAPVRGAPPAKTADIDPETKRQLEELKRTTEIQKKQNNAFS